MDEQAQSNQSKRSKVRPIILAGGIAALCVVFSISAITYVLTPTPRLRGGPMKPSTVLRLLSQAMVVYAGDHDDMYPDKNNWEQVLISFGLIDSSLLISPVEDGDGVSYIFVPGPFSFDSTQILLYEDPKHFEDGVLVAFADTHVEMVDHETFERMLAEQLGSD